MLSPGGGEAGETLVIPISFKIAFLLIASSNDLLVSLSDDTTIPILDSIILRLREEAKGLGGLTGRGRLLPLGDKEVLFSGELLT